jgi:ArsR family transcriptional regulator
MQKQQLQAISQFFKTLGDATRLQIVVELTEKEQNVSTLCKALKSRQPTVSHHLSILRMGGVVETKRSGKEIFYSIQPKYGKALRAVLADGVAMFKA